MTWLLTQMWAVLALAGLAGLLFGLGLRGAMLRGKLRRAEVERGLAQTELDQARTEIEGLYAAQRKMSVSAASPDIDTAIRRADDRIAELEAALNAARTSDTAGAPISAPTPIGGATRILGEAAPDSSGDTVNLEWRNRYLESRVRSLEARLESAPGDAAAPAPQVSQQGASHDAVVAGVPDAATGVDAAKLLWQNDYLRMRLRAFEGEAGLVASEIPETVAGGLQFDPSSTDTNPKQLAAVDDGRETPDEELARLRWRNRYLEGRLAYLEEERSKDAGDAATAQTGIAAPVMDSETAQAASAHLPDATAATPLDEYVDTSSHDVTQPDPAPVGLAIATPHTAETVEPAAHVEEAPAAGIEVPNFADEISAELEKFVADDDTVHIDPAGAPVSPEPPPSLDAPRDGTGDDLTLILGVGPRIQEVLNGIGIHHFDQISIWTPANVAWIDQYLSFDGRVEREDWVGQARKLVESAINPA